MDLPGAGSRFDTDQRAVSQVIGSILLFGIFILALTTYQAQVVPEQNAAIEFDHFEQIQDELVTVRNSVSTAGQVDVSQFTSLSLGPDYQMRLLTINPPPPTGTFQTSDAYNITITNGTEAYDVNVTTRFLEYQPGYNELTAGSMWYEHSVLYLDERDRGDYNIIEQQNLVTGSGTLRITALQNAYQETGTERVSIELYPAETTGELPEGELRIGIPTRLNASEYWADQFDPDPDDIYDSVDEDAYEDGIHRLNLSTDSSDVEISTVGIRSEPDEGPFKNTQVENGAGGGGGGGDFTQLDATLATSGGGKPDSVTMDTFETTSSSDITFTATEGSATPDTDTQTASGPSGGGITLDLGGGGNNEYPVTVTAEIDGGECLETTFTDGGPTSQSLSDWSGC